MQSVNAAFTAEEKDTSRDIKSSLQISWHKQYLLSNRTFTIGVSLIGGNDIIGINPGAIGSPGNYKYFDESSYVMSLGWERGLNLPTGGISKALAEAVLDNTSRRFTPRYMGGSSEIATAIQPRKPAIINAGFTVNGAPYMLPQFAGVLTEQPAVDLRQRTVSLKMADYIDYFQNKFLDNAVMFSSQRTDQVMSTLLSQLGMNTAQYDLDYGINIIPFGMFDVGTRVSDIFQQLTEAEMGHFYQDESGIFKFENRQHWQNSPYTQVQKVISTGQVYNAEAPNEDHLINVVEVKSSVRNKQPRQIVFQLSSPLALPNKSDTTLFISFNDPVLALENPGFYFANTLSDGTGTDITSNISVKSVDKFAQAAKVVFTNNSVSDGFLTDLTLYGRPAKVSVELYYRAKDGSSVTAYEERTLTIENDFIQSQSLAETIANMILVDFSAIENIQRLTIKAMPDLQLGDLISWQGRYWRIFDIKTTLDPSSGFIQELLMIQRTIVGYFRIGISTIGGSDQISP